MVRLISSSCRSGVVLAVMSGGKTDFLLISDYTCCPAFSSPEKAWGGNAYKLHCYLSFPFISSHEERGRYPCPLLRFHFHQCGMQLHSLDTTNLRPCPFFHFSSPAGRCKPPRIRKSPSFFVESSKRSSDATEGLQKDSKNMLSRILRTEAAVRNIGRKANSAKYTRLWPKAVLEALDDATNSNQWEAALKIFGLLRKQHWYSAKCQTYAKLLMMLGKCRQPDQARSLFQTMLSEGLKPSVDVFTALVGAYGLSGRFAEAFHLIVEMKSIPDCRPDAYTYTMLINCASKLGRIDLFDRMLMEMSYLGIECTTVTYNVIIDGYGKARMFELMENSLSDMLETGSCLPDVFTLNSLIWAYGNDGQIEKIEQWYDEFRHMGVEPDIKTFNILIRSYGMASLYEKMGAVMDYMKKRFYTPTVATYNIIIETFGKAGNIEKMEYFFRSMKYQGVKPNSITYCSLVNGYSKAGLFNKFHTILRQIENSDIVLDTPFFNCIISAYGQAGKLKMMEQMFVLMKERKCEPDNITFATMIQAYRSQGMDDAAQELETSITKVKKSKVKNKLEPSTPESGDASDNYGLFFFKRDLPGQFTNPLSNLVRLNTFSYQYVSCASQARRNRFYICCGRAKEGRADFLKSLGCVYE
ncbi:hypothetical protein ACLOJK_006220 [Asimina triloba]